MDTVGTVYMGLGLFDQARPLIDGAVAKRRHLQGIDPLDLSDSLSHQGDLMALQADYAAGEKAYREAIRIESARPRRPAKPGKTGEFALRPRHVARTSKGAMRRPRRTCARLWSGNRRCMEPRIPRSRAR